MVTDTHMEVNYSGRLRFEPLAKSNWNKFAELFGEKGACGNCWCMYYRLNKDEFNEGKVNEGNRQAMKQLVWSGQPTGIIAFYGDVPVAWCAFAPRKDFEKLSRSRVHKPIDDQPVWSIPCTFIAKNFRRRGVSVELLKGIVSYAREKGISIIEAYPTIPTQESLPDSFAWIGLYKSFERAGFRIVDTTSKNRPMVRYYVEGIEQNL
ncbi:GNAT family N-acetyltransferase [Flavihumibacter sp. R14]|nr:GNAT family N-acetyltransferase [Flavihumibacter soli]